MDRRKAAYREGSRAARFLKIRDAVLARSHQMQPINFGYELRLGSFQIHYAPPGTLGPLRPFNMQIWPAGRLVAPGCLLHENKVANVDWTQWDEVGILSYRSGPWEAELLGLLKETNVSFLPSAGAR